MAKKYIVEVERASCCTFEIEVENAKEAEAKAEQAAYDRDWARDDADYRVGRARRGTLL